MKLLHLVLLKIYKHLPKNIRFIISYFHSDKFVVGVTAIIKKGDQILLTKNTYQHVWTLPGGWVTFGETFQQSVEREIMEELGIKIIIERVIEVNAIKDRPAIDIFILCHYDKGVLHPDLVEVEKAKFFSLNKLPERIFSVHKKYIDKYKMI